MTPGHFVYLIVCGQYVKIGHSHAPEKRLHSLDVGPVDSHVAHTWAFEDRPAAVRMEGRLHKLFAQHRVRGEWFLMDKEWPLAVGDAALRFDGAAVRVLLALLSDIREAEGVVAGYEADDDPEEADVWRGVCSGYLTRARSFGLPMSDWDAALAEWRAA